MAKYLAIFNDIIDDVSVNGFSVMTEKEVETFEELANSISWSFIYEVNDELEIDYSDGEELLSKIEFKEITVEESKTLKRLFNSQFGVFIDENFLIKVIGDESTDDYYDEDDIDYDLDY
jgi:hypothetical protein